jgi:hypothetical protein
VAGVPSIKATGFQGAADDLGQLLASGRVTREQLEKRLDQRDFAYLGKALAASSWVPIDTYVRVSNILGEVEGGGDVPGYFRARGRRAAERLHKAGLYKQFDASSETWGKRAGKIATTLSSVLYNFTRWTFETKEGRHPFQIVIDDAREFPESLRFVGEGFIAYTSLNQSGGRDVRVTSERVTPDRIVYTVEVD